MEIQLPIQTKFGRRERERTGSTHCQETHCMRSQSKRILWDENLASPYKLPIIQKFEVHLKNTTKDQAESSLTSLQFERIVVGLDHNIQLKNVVTRKP